MLREKIAYAMGDAGAGGIVWKVMCIAFPLYFTDVFGLSFADAAVLMLVARLFDVVTDPLMGSIADRTQSRWGTYRPWLIFGAIPFGLVFALLLTTPDFGPVGKRIYAYTVYLLMMAVYTMVNVPYGSLLDVMTADDDEKNQFSAYRMVGAYAMGFVMLEAFPYLQRWVGGTPQHQYAMAGWILGGVAAVLTLVCGLLTRERLKPVRAERFSLRQYANLLHNGPWLRLTAMGICTNFFTGFRYAVAGYMISYCLDGDVSIGGFLINYTVGWAASVSPLCVLQPSASSSRLPLSLCRCPLVTSGSWCCCWCSHRWAWASIPPCCGLCMPMWLIIRRIASAPRRRGSSSRRARWHRSWGELSQVRSLPCFWVWLVLIWYRTQLAARCSIPRPSPPLCAPWCGLSSRFFPPCLP